MKKSMTNLNVKAIIAVLVFSAATLALSGFVLIGLCLSFALSFVSKNNMKTKSDQAA